MLIPIIVFLIAIAMIIAEVRKPGRKFPEVAGWWARAFLLNLMQVVVIYLSGVAWDKWFLEYRLWSWEGVSPTVGGLLGYLIMTFVFYWWHRWRHQFDILWKWFHQLHHSPQRLEIITAFYKHPFEQIADSVISSLILYVLVGLNAQAATYAILLSGLGELFYHWNVSTPYWIGFIIQRPEMHCIHHQDGLHKYNYSDLPLWDILFGTFKNPKSWQGNCGLGQEEHRFGELLMGIDVSKQQAERV